MNTSPTIQSIEAVLVDLPTIRAHKLAMTTMMRQTLVIVRLVCSEGFTGIGEATTIGGLVTEWLGHVPRAGETVERGGIRIEVLAGDDLKVEQVRVSKAKPETVPQSGS